MPKTNIWEKGEGKKILKILDKFVDNFINIFQTKLQGRLLHLSRTLLHGIYIVLLPSPLKNMESQNQYQRQNCKRLKSCGKQ